MFASKYIMLMSVEFHKFLSEKTEIFQFDVFAALEIWTKLLLQYPMIINILTETLNSKFLLFFSSILIPSV